MATLIIISWRDIPAQVLVKRGRESAKVQLSARFQEAVDRAAMRAGKGSSDAYLADWKRSAPQSCGDDLPAVAAAEAARLEAAFSDQDLEALIRAKGLLSAGG
jgi:Virulence factor